MLLGALVPAALCEDFEISPDIFASRSPSGLLLDFIGIQGEDSIFQKVVELLPSAAKTEYPTLTADGPDPNDFDCNLTGVDAECFLIQLAGQLGKPWGQEEADVTRVQAVIEKMLAPRNLVKQAAVLACIASPVYMRLFSVIGYDAGTATAAIGAAKDTCTETDAP